MIVVPDNASTASNQITQTSRAREVNTTYSEFLEYHHTAAVPTRAGRPQDKGNVEAGVKIVTHWIIHFLSDRVFTTIDDLNAAIGERLEFINSRVPFRGQPRSRQDWFDTHERSELMALPEVRWEPVIWRKAKVHRDWHIQIDTIKYSVPSTYAGLNVDVRIIGTTVDVLYSDRVIASHHKGRLRNSYVTSVEHAPPGHGDSADLWTRSYFLRQASKTGPATTTALESLLNSRKIEAQGYRSCMNILELGKRGNRLLLEQACRDLISEHPPRPISYTAVKNQLAAVRARADQRPTVYDPAGHPDPAHDRPLTGRDTSRAYLAGASAFSLDSLTREETDHA